MAMLESNRAIHFTAADDHFQNKFKVKAYQKNSTRLRDRDIDTLLQNQISIDQVKRVQKKLSYSNLKQESRQSQSLKNFEKYQDIWKK